MRNPPSSDGTALDGMPRLVLIDFGLAGTAGSACWNGPSRPLTPDPSVGGGGAESLQGPVQEQR